MKLFGGSGEEQLEDELWLEVSIDLQLEMDQSLKVLRRHIGMDETVLSRAWFLNSI